MTVYLWDKACDPIRSWSTCYFWLERSLVLAGDSVESTGRLGGVPDHSKHMSFWPAESPRWWLHTRGNRLKEPEQTVLSILGRSWIHRPGLSYDQGLSGWWWLIKIVFTDSNNCLLTVTGNRTDPRYTHTLEKNNNITITLSKTRPMTPWEGTARDRNASSQLQGNNNAIPCWTKRLISHVVNISKYRDVMWFL